LRPAAPVSSHRPGCFRLRARAGAHATFTGWVDDDRLRELYRSAIALVCPSIEEFGIVMAEAQACGTPVVAPRAGGALDIVDDGVTGRLVDGQSPSELAAALHDLPDDPGACRASAARFAEERFVDRLGGVLDAYAPTASIASTARSSGDGEASSAAAARAATLA